MLVYLVGMRGSGKTTIGKLLSEKAGVPFYDTDKLFCDGEKCTISKFVSVNGWEEFRKREGNILADLSDKDGIVATGGGMVLAKENREVMRDSGQVFFLNVPLDVLRDRLLQHPENEARPSLTGLDLLEELEDVYEQREELYRDAANHEINGNLPPEEVVMSILRHLVTGEYA